MSNYKKLIGENVYLAPLSKDHLAQFAVWMNDFSVTDYTGRSHAIVTDEAEMAWYENTQKTGECIMSIIKIENDELIGNIGFHKIDHLNRYAELGIMIGENKNRSKGYGTEAIKLLLDFGFNYLNLHNITLTLLSANERAKRCYEKAGFKEAGRIKECRFLNGKYYDRIYMQILSTEFEGDQIKNKEVK